MGHGDAVTSLDLAPWSRVRARGCAPDVAKSRLKVMVIEGDRLAVP